MPQQLNDYEKLQKRYSTLDEALYYLKYLLTLIMIIRGIKL